MTSPTLGQKVKFFRTLKNFKQLELELAAGISEGSVSRMETDLINPTKEVLHKISKALELTIGEELYLFNSNYLFPSELEIERIQKLVESSFKSNFYFAYLLDPKDCHIKASKGMLNLCKLSSIDYKNLIGVNVIEALLNPKYNVRQIVPDNDLEEIILNNYERERLERPFLTLEPWFKQLENKLTRETDFARFKSQIGIKSVEPYSIKARTLKFKILGINMTFHYSITPLMSDPRFTLVEYDLGHFANKIRKVIDGI